MPALQRTQLPKLASNTLPATNAAKTNEKQWLAEVVRCLESIATPQPAWPEAPSYSLSSCRIKTKQYIYQQTTSIIKPTTYQFMMVLS